MILTKTIKHGEVELIRHYSDQNLVLRQIETNELFDDAIDIMPCQFTYEETNIPIANDSELDAEELSNILLGEEK